MRMLRAKRRRDTLLHMAQAFRHLSLCIHHLRQKRYPHPRTSFWIKACAPKSLRQVRLVLAQGVRADQILRRGALRVRPHLHP